MLAQLINNTWKRKYSSFSCPSANLFNGKGGLGVWDFCLVNFVLQGKWYWRLISRKLRSWRDILDIKFHFSGNYVKCGVLFDLIGASCALGYMVSFFWVGLSFVRYIYEAVVVLWYRNFMWLGCTIVLPGDSSLSLKFSFHWGGLLKLETSWLWFGILMQLTTSQTHLWNSSNAWNKTTNPFICLSAIFCVFLSIEQI